MTGDEKWKGKAFPLLDGKFRIFPCPNCNSKELRPTDHNWPCVRCHEHLEGAPFTVEDAGVYFSKTKEETSTSSKVVASVAVVVIFLACSTAGWFMGGGWSGVCLWWLAFFSGVGVQSALGGHVHE